MKTDQLNQIIAFMESQPQLLDISGTKRMACVDEMSSTIVQQMIDEAKLNPDLEPLQILEAIVHGAALPSGD